MLYWTMVLFPPIKYGCAACVPGRLWYSALPFGKGMQRLFQLDYGTEPSRLVWVCSVCSSETKLM